METVSLGVAGNRRPESNVRLAVNRSGFGNRRSPLFDLSVGLTVTSIALATALAPNVSFANPNVSSSQSTRKAPAAASTQLANLPSPPSVTLRQPTLEHNHFAPHSNAVPHSHHYDAVEATLEGEEVRSVGDVNLPMNPLDHRRNDNHRAFTLRQESVNFASFTGRVLWTHNFEDSWTRLQACADSRATCFRLLSTTATFAYSTGRTIMEAESETGHRTRFFAPTNTGLLGASILTGTTFRGLTLFAEAGLFARYNSTSLRRNITLDNETHEVNFADENVSLGPATLNLRLVTGSPLNVRLGGALYTPLTDLSNAAIYGGPEINWNRTISTMITGGFTYMDHQDVPFVEAFPAYLNFPAGEDEGLLEGVVVDEEAGVASLTTEPLQPRPRFFEDAVTARFQGEEALVCRVVPGEEEFHGR
jgi:hypothetical protein